MKPGFAISASNINTSITRGALLPERGRTELFDASAFNFGGKQIANVNIIYPCVGPQNAPGVLFQGTDSNGVLLTGYYQYSGTFTNVTQAVKFTQACQYKNVVYTNGGQRFFPGLDNTKMYVWQYSANDISQNVVINFTYAIATLGFSGSITNGDVLTTHVTTSGAGTQSIPYTVGSVTANEDVDFAALSENIANAINTWYNTGAGAGVPNKVTASALVNFDLAATPGAIATNPAQGVLLSSNASGNIGNTFTVSVSMTSGGGGTPTEGYQLTGPTTAGFFYGANTNVGNMDGGYYFYIFTQTTTMPDGTVSETSAYPQFYAGPIQANVGAKTYGSNSAVTLSDTHAPPTYQWTGTNPDGTTYTTNIYRASSLQTNFIYQLVGNKADNGTPFVDTYSDAEISGNATLTVHRDPPPFVTNTTLVQNLGFMTVHHNSLWALVVQPGAELDGSPQVQLWWSNFDRGWEFDDTAQVLLLQSDVVVNPEAAGPNYDDFYGNMPKGLVEVGTTLIAKMKRVSWVIWGDGSTANPYVAKPIFTYGLLSSATGALGAKGGEFFITESGDLYFYDGSAPTDRSGDVQSALKVSSVNPGVSYADLQASCIAFSNDTVYWAFPTKGFTLSYDVSAGAWMSSLPYAAATKYGIASTPGNPATYENPLLPNEVLAVRAGQPTVVDQWFSNVSGDAGNAYQIYSWDTPHMDFGKPDWVKRVKEIRLFAPKGYGVVTVTLMADNGDDPQQTVSVPIDLSGSQQSLTKMLYGNQGKLMGYYFQVAISVQSIPGKPAPVIWGLGLYGNLVRRLIPESPDPGV